METKLIAAEMASGAGVTTVITSSKRPENISNIIEYHNSLKRRSGNASPSSESAPRPSSVPLHTIFTPSPTPMRDLKSWTSHTLYPAGSVIIDAGAHSVLSRRESGGRLLAAGVTGVIGSFASGQAVRIVVLPRSDPASAAQKTRPSTPSLPVTPLEDVDDTAGVSEDDIMVIEKYSDANVIEVGRGLANYNSVQISKVKGLNRYVASFCLIFLIHRYSSYISQMLGYADSEYVVENITIRVPP